MTIKLLYAGYTINYYCMYMIINEDKCVFNEYNGNLIISYEVTALYPDKVIKL